MRNECLDVARFQPISLEEFLTQFRLLAYRVLENRLPILMDIVHLLIHSFVRRRMQAAASGHVEGATTRAINLVHEVDQTH